MHRILWRRARGTKMCGPALCGPGSKSDVLIVPQLCPTVFNFVPQLCLARLPSCHNLHLKILYFHVNGGKLIFICKHGDRWVFCDMVIKMWPLWIFQCLTSVSTFLYRIKLISNICKENTILPWPYDFPKLTLFCYGLTSSPHVIASSLWHLTWRRDTHNLYGW